MNPQHSDEDTIGTDVVLREVPAGVALSTPEEARQRAKEIRGHLTLGFGKLTLARECRDDLALGYDSWHLYLAGEYGALDTLGLPAEERRYAVTSMRADGMSQRVIAAQLDTSLGTVNADLRKASTQVAEIRGADGKVYAASRERKAPEPFVRTPGMSKRAEVVARIAAAGPRGLTCLELERATRWRHGIASSPLSAVARQGLVVQAGTVLVTDPQPSRRGGRVLRAAGNVREGYAVWVTPEHAIIGAELVEDEEGRA